MTHKPLKTQTFGLIGWLLLCYAAATVGALASIDAAGYYKQLAQPTWAPPAWLFGPVWSVLYTMMAIAAWLVWRRNAWQQVRMALIVFAAQLLANAIWTWLFFTLHLGAIATAEITLLWLLIALTIYLFRRHDAMAALLLVPYLLWVSFALALTVALWRLNPALLG